MGRRTKQGLRLGGLGMVGLLLAASPQRGDAPRDPIGPVPTSGAGPANADRGAGPLHAGLGAAVGAAVDAAQAYARADPAGEGPLAGLSGAAAALAIGDYAQALRLTQDATPEPGSPDWYRLGALRGRAFLRAARPAEAAAELAPLWDHEARGAAFPAEVLGFELARAQVAWAADGSMAEGEADRARSQALKVLRRVRSLSPLRTLGEVRILEVETRLQMQGRSEREAVDAARKAASAAERALRAYPNHPRVGELWLGRGLALARGGQRRAAAAVLRDIYIQRAGEPEAQRAWAELQALAQRGSKKWARELSASEQLVRAASARRLRWVDLSREILDEVLATARSAAVRNQARSARAYTAYKQRDFRRCAEDLRPLYDATGNYELRDRLLRCLERGAMYEEALGIYEGMAKKAKRRGSRANAAWNALQLAVRAGLYERAEGYLAQYETLSSGHRQARTWLRAWLPMRLGRFDDAIAAFEACERYASDRKRAQYFRGKLLLRTSRPADQDEGARLLTEVIANNPLGYYGLLARQRLIEGGRPVPEAPVLEPMSGEADHPTRAEVTATLAAADAEFGDAWPMLRRARALYSAGYLEEARRELRVAVRAYETRGKKAGGVRNESFVVGLSWKPEWRYPRIRPTRAGFQTLRSQERSARLREALRELARGLDEPHRVAKLSGSEHGHAKARWHPRAFRAAVEREARHFGVDPVHLWSLMYTESRFRRFVVSPVGARGALQIMPWTARQLAERLGELEPGRSFDDDRLFDIDTNAHLAGYYVAELLRKFHGQAPLAYASYNGGPSNVQRWVEAKGLGSVPLECDVFVEEIAFRESYRYTKRVTEVSAAYELLYRGELPRWPNLLNLEVENNIAF